MQKSNGKMVGESSKEWRRNIANEAGTTAVDWILKEQNKGSKLLFKVGSYMEEVLTQMPRSQKCCLLTRSQSNN